MDLLAIVRTTILEEELISKGRRVVVALSGGPDSTALLNALSELSPELGVSLVCAHLDHGLREESTYEAALAANMAGDLDVKFFSGASDVRDVADKKGISVEHAGRIERYRFLEEVRLKSRADVIATGHHRDDEIETFFMRLFKGSSMEGLSGIPVRRGRLIRPLIRAWRREIISFLKGRGIDFAIDRTNLESNTDRNFIRNRLIPVIQEGFPNYDEPLSRTISLIEKENRFLSQLAQDAYSNNSSREGGRIVFDLEKLGAMDPALAARVLKLGLYELGGPELRVSARHVSAIMDLISGSKKHGALDLGRSLTARRGYNRLELGIDDNSRKNSVPYYEIPVVGPGAYRVEQVGMELEFVVGNITGPMEYEADMDKQRAYFDADKIDFPLIIRPRKPGDRLIPWKSGGSTKVKDLMIDKKMPLELRSLWPLVLKDDEIVWVPGIRRGSKAGITENTERYMIMKVKGNAV
jgi:tRNA(Ile)-lysidine synthase